MHDDHFPVEGASHSSSSIGGLVYIVDDDEALREELQDLIAGAGYDVQPFQSSIDFLDNVRADIPVCVLLDIRMPVIDGITAQRRLVEIAPHATVIIISGHGDIPLAVQAIQAGALNFMEKPASAAAILASVANALAVARERQGASQDRDSARTIIESLSKREYQVLQGMVAGYANKMIAYQLDLSQRTVEIYRSKLMQKLRVKSLPLAVRTAIAAGVPPLEAEARTSAPSADLMLPVGLPSIELSGSSRLAA